jgi:hypothetical protein
MTDFGVSAEKYAAATATSASVAAFASPIINFGGILAGTEVPLTPFLKSTICFTI